MFIFRRATFVALDVAIQHTRPTWVGRKLGKMSKWEVYLISEHQGSWMLDGQTLPLCLRFEIRDYPISIINGAVTLEFRKLDDATVLQTVRHYKQRIEPEMSELHANGHTVRLED